MRYATTFPLEGWLLPPRYSHRPQSQVQGGMNLSEARARSQAAGRPVSSHHLWGKAAAWSPELGASIPLGEGGQEAGPGRSSPTSAHVVQGNPRAGLGVCWGQCVY